MCESECERVSVRASVRVSETKWASVRVSETKWASVRVSETKWASVRVSGRAAL